MSREVDNDPGVRDVARRLTTPALSGVVLTRERLRDIAAQLDLPIAPGDRGQMLAAAFQSAAEYDQLAALLEVLSQEAEHWDTIYTEWAAQFPTSAAIWADWRERLSGTRRQLESMRQAVRDAGQTPP